MDDARSFWVRRLIQALCLIAILAGMSNVTPAAPFLPDIGNYPDQYFRPFMFGLFMLIMVLTFPFSRKKGTGEFRLWGLFIDIAFVVSIAALILAYLEIKETVGFNVFTEKPTAAADTGGADPDADAVADVLGLGTFSDTITVLDTEPPAPWVLVAFLSAVAFTLLYAAKIWGIPVVLFSLLMVSYAAITYFVDRWGWAPGNAYLATEIANPGEFFRNLLTNDERGIFGQFLRVLLTVVFPYIVLGALFAESAGGKSLIKLAVRSTRRLRGGPAHAAIVSSAMFGTVSGGPVVNVLSTGTLTIPMMSKRGFRPKFAGAVEAAASSGGQIMPPVMGIAAFLLASLTGVGYASVALAAVLPALCYFASLFMTVTIESRKQNIEPSSNLTEDMILDRQDWINLAIIIIPILTIVATLIITANERAAGFWAVFAMLLISFVDPNIRKAPLKLYHAILKGGGMVSQVFLLFMAVTLVDVSLNVTGFSVDFKNSVLRLIENIETVNLFGTTFMLPAGLYLFLTLVLGMLAAILLGMGMPTLPAYANVALFMAPVLGALGTSLFTAHMFVFYFAVASAITPPVAIAAFAASTITKTEPMATSFEAVKVGALMLIVPFIFAFHPELLLIEDAFLTSSGNTIASHPNGFTLLGFLWIVVRLPLVLYLIATALVGFDRQSVNGIERILRLLVAVGCLSQSLAVGLIFVAAAVVLVALHWRQAAASDPASAA